RPRMSRSTTSPCLSGSRRSMTMASYSLAAMSASALRASGAWSGVKPLCASARTSHDAISSSSSTSNMRMAVGLGGQAVGRTALAMDPLAQIPGFVLAPEQNAGKLVQRQGVDLALELDDGIQRHPILAPAPGVELGMLRSAQAYVAVAADQAQQKPD